ncbi:hypothetical protein RclHR1_36780002 [Rhizophagus clarus]|uniref:Uncharacterized protein n=1 Tax=Rhizophagus clarus TaxID=94130 RepID=A0A2Z6RNW4_9GLOM|nr:hypothetical protein RclHR1_36780002 [Rhizophagus clarus]GES80600.1 hypothetical protein RCL_e16212_RclHR1_36780002 [Rhizophagus clarus]
MEPPTSEDLDSLTALVSRNRAKANKLRNDFKKCRKLLSKLVTDLLIVSEPATHAQLVTNVVTLSHMILDGSFSLAACHRQITTDELRLSMWTRNLDLSSNLHEVAPADSVMIEPIVKLLPKLKVFLPKKRQKHRRKNFHLRQFIIFISFFFVSFYYATKKFLTFILHVCACFLVII